MCSSRDTNALHLGLAGGLAEDIEGVIRHEIGCQFRDPLPSLAGPLQHFVEVICGEVVSETVRAGDGQGNQSVHSSTRPVFGRRFEGRL